MTLLRRSTLLPLAGGLGLALALAGCGTPESAQKPAAASTSVSAASAASAPAVPPPPLVAAAFNEAVARAGNRLVADAQTDAGDAPRELIIDPLIDGSTGQQTASSVQMGEQLAAIIKTRSPGWNIRPLSRESIANSPLLLLGTLTAINTPNVAADAAADAFRICLTLTDMRTGRIVAKQVDRATAATVNAEPTPFFRDSPTWQKDKTVNAYIKSCQGSKKGDSIDPAYLIRLPAEALLNEAITAYSAGKVADANRLYREAALVAEPDDLRVLNGIYLTSWRLGKRKEAVAAFDKIVDVGLEAKRLPVKLLFTPNTTNLLAVADLQTQYGIWVKELALQVTKRPGCVKVVGHTSRTGTPAANDSLSQRRATSVMQSLGRQNKQLGDRISAEGVGSRENLIGLGTDDNRDALDRRVEFRVIDCS